MKTTLQLLAVWNLAFTTLGLLGPIEVRAATGRDSQGTEGRFTEKLTEFKYPVEWALVPHDVIAKIDTSGIGDIKTEVLDFLENPPSKLDADMTFQLTEKLIALVTQMGPSLNPQERNLLIDGVDSVYHRLPVDKQRVLRDAIFDMDEALGLPDERWPEAIRAQKILFRYQQAQALSLAKRSALSGAFAPAVPGVIWPVHEKEDWTSSQQRSWESEDGFPLVPVTLAGDMLADGYSNVVGIAEARRNKRR